MLTPRPDPSYHVDAPLPPIPIDPTAAILDMHHRYLIGVMPYINKPTIALTVASVDPVNKTVKLQHKGDLFPTGYNYPYLAGYVPFVGDHVQVQNLPSGLPFVHAAFAAPPVAPVASVTAAAGTGGSVSLSGGPLSGTLTLVVGTSPTSGVVCTVTYSASGIPSLTPSIQLTPTNATAAGAGNHYITTASGGGFTTAFSLAFVSAPAPGTYTFMYTVTP